MQIINNPYVINEGDLVGILVRRPDKEYGYTMRLCEVIFGYNNGVNHVWRSKEEHGVIDMRNPYRVRDLITGKIRYPYKTVTHLIKEGDGSKNFKPTETIYNDAITLYREHVLNKLS